MRLLNTSAHSIGLLTRQSRSARRCPSHAEHLPIWPIVSVVHDRVTPPFERTAMRSGLLPRNPARADRTFCKLPHITSAARKQDASTPPYRHLTCVCALCRISAQTPLHNIASLDLAMAFLNWPVFTAAKLRDLLWTAVMHELVHSSDLPKSIVLLEKTLSTVYRLFAGLKDHNHHLCNIALSL